ncbi:HIT family protein [Pandoraea apista]|uniref:HIT family protein n=1 Tax=Pandoraea apista TaxID=93218 RepID=A0A0B5FGG7_9BURK|nr:HIT family protein [Pandoraea apista]AJE98863.1 histidine triad (HIT) protein [Pandoraea apista]AKH72944.1 histidine triad (HIT) protein [Pandoraea apista]AKI61329.1 histidine triad (HIT) protein [Pandoraea apista]ALS65618.1 HIT family protein [Pandoraea apista]AVF39522.1 HIT family protein [Pandoraea apista]
MECPFCTGDGGEVVWRDAVLRVVLANESGYPGFTRVIWHAHVAEMSDLPEAAREHVMRAVFGVEAALRTVMSPDKVNVASLGNMVPHVHWHVIPRYRDDIHFPGSVWSAPQREVPQARLAERAAWMPALRQAIVAELDRVPAWPA